MRTTTSVGSSHAILLGFLVIFQISCIRFQPSEAFQGPTRSSFTQRKSSTKLYNDDSLEDRTADGSFWKLPNDFSMFLTQRSIQSFMFLTSQLRDPETCYWVEDFTKPNLFHLEKDGDFSLADAIPNLSDAGTTDWNPSESKEDENKEDEERRTCHLLRYHGLAAMDMDRFPTWEKYFEVMLEQPVDSWIIASDHPHIPDYIWEIDPSSLCSRILSVREQLSREFAKDLQAVADMGGQTLDWYWDQLRQSRDREEQQDESENSEHLEDAMSDTGNPLINPSSLRGSRQNLLFLELNVDSPSLDHKPSPLRRGNFDLLVLLATEEAIQRVLNKWESQKQSGDLTGPELASQSFLEDFYIHRQQFFQGPLPSYGKADDILEELLFSAIRFQANDAAFIDPTQIAEIVLKEREQVALEWKEMALEAPQHHMVIQKLRLDRMMMGNQPSPSLSSETIQSSHDPGPGAFE